MDYNSKQNKQPTYVKRYTTVLVTHDATKAYDSGHFKTARTLSPLAESCHDVSYMYMVI